MRGGVWHRVRRFAVRPAALMVRLVRACRRMAAQRPQGACVRKGAGPVATMRWVDEWAWRMLWRKLFVWQAETARGMCSVLGSRKRSQSSTMQVAPLSRRTLGARKASPQAQWLGHCWCRTEWRMVWTSALLRAGGRRTGDWRHPGVLGGTQMAGMLGCAVAAS